MMHWDWGYYAPWDWLWMALMMVIFWAVVIGFAVWAIRSLGGLRGQSDAALDALRKRLANGQISREEFESTKRVLEG